MKRSRFLILFLLLSVALSSCVMRPSNVLSKRKMERVLYDLHKTDGVIYINGLNHNDEEQNKFYQATLAKYGVTQAQFDSSLVWYTDNPKRFNKIYPAVVKRLQAELDSFAWLDERQEYYSTSPADIYPYDFDSLAGIISYGLPIIYRTGTKPLAKDTALYYIFPIDSIDSISLSVSSISVIEADSCIKENNVVIL